MMQLPAAISYSLYLGSKTALKVHQGLVLCPRNIPEKSRDKSKIILPSELRG
jgi:hypothetical protein